MNKRRRGNLEVSERYYTSWPEWCSQIRRKTSPKHMGGKGITYVDVNGDWTDGSFSVLSLSGDQDSRLWRVTLSLVTHEFACSFSAKMKITKPKSQFSGPMHVIENQLQRKWSDSRLTCASMWFVHLYNITKGREPILIPLQNRNVFKVY